MEEFDTYDRRLLRQMQLDAAQSIEALADLIGLSRNATWRRIKRLEDSGVIRGRVALVDPEQVGLGLLVFISVRTDRHDVAWARDFARVVRSFPEIVRAYRTSGEQDYLIHARVRDVKAYDLLYQRLISQIELKNVSASFAMEELKDTTVLPI
ncbi:MAG: Lrp/AsnC family transcriptional regulator [Sedimentitalea sp.]